MLLGIGIHSTCVFVPFVALRGPSWPFLAIIVFLLGLRFSILVAIKRDAMATWPKPWRMFRVVPLDMCLRWLPYDLRQDLRTAHHFALAINAPLLLYFIFRIQQ